MNSMKTLTGMIYQNKVCLDIANLEELYSLIEKAKKLNKELEDVIHKISCFDITFEFSEKVTHEE